MLLFPSHYGSLLYGASAGVCGVFTIFALLQGNSTIWVNFFIPVRARTLLMIFAAITLFFTLVPARGDNTAHAAHLGGLLAGWWFVRLGWHHDFQPLPWSDAWARFQAWWQHKGGSPTYSRRPPQRWPDWFDSLANKPTRRSAPPRAEMDDSFMSEKVDPILDKISAHGIQSLTEEERRILERARAKMSK